MGNEKITIIGAGNGGFAAAADLAIRGHQVTLFEMPEFAKSIEEIQKTGYIELECLPSNGLKGGKAYLHLITTDIRAALEEAEIVFVIAPTYAHEAMAEVVAPYIKDHMIVVLTPANFGGSIIFRRALIAHGCSEKVRVAEFDTMMYATRKKGNTGSWIRGYKHNLGCAVFPSDGDEEVFSRLKGIYPHLVKRENVLITGVSNINSYGHPACMLGNIPRIDMAAEDKEKYKWKMNEGKTDSVCKLREALDKEHMGLREVGFNVVSALDIYKEYYNYQYQYEHPGTDPEPMEVWRNNPIYVESMGPNSWQHRYLTEDIPFGLVPIEELLEKCELPHPVISSMIDLANCLCGRDFRKEGLTLEKVGIKDMNLEQLNKFLATGICEQNTENTELDNRRFVL